MLATVTAFPRGGRRPSSKQDDDVDPNREVRKERPSERKKKRKAEEEAGLSFAGKSDNRSNTAPMGTAGSAISATSPDFLFGQKKSTENDLAKSQSKKLKSSSNNNSNKHSLLPLGGGGVVIPSSTPRSHKASSTSPTFTTSPVIEALSFAKLNKGTKMLGTVREVQDEFAVISLPNLLTGYMLLDGVEQRKKATHGAAGGMVGVSSLRQCLQVGQILSVAVLKVATETLPGGSGGPKRRIQVSALPTHVNPREGRLTMATIQPLRGQILSIEDHGCLIDLGLGRQGFLKFDHVDGDYTVLEDGDIAATEDQDENKNHKNDDDDDDDEDDDDDDNGGAKKKKTKKKRKIKNKATDKPRILQPGRLYDFLAATGSSTNSMDNNTLAATNTAVISLTLPLTSSLAQQMVVPPTSKDSSPYSLSSLQPGMMVTTKVEALAKNGLCVTFLGNVFRGAIELGSHLGGHDFVGIAKESLSLLSSSSSGSSNNFETAWRKVFDRHQHFPARIIAIDVPTKLIRLSIAPHILALTPPPIRLATIADAENKNKNQNNDTNTSSPFVVGKILHNCTVVRVDHGIGAVLALPQEYHGKTAMTTALPKRLIQRSDLFANESFQLAMSTPAVYVHISKAFDDPEEGKKKKKGKNDNKSSRHELNAGYFAKDFSLGSKHTVRILNTGHWMDGVASGGCAPSILEAHVLTHADLKPGQLYKQVTVCAQLNGGSVLINLGGSPGNPVRGLIPSPLHLMDSNKTGSTSDFRKRVLETKFAVDAKVDVRVLTVDHAKKRCIVTAKKSLVKVDDESQVVSSYQDLQVGQTAIGFVSKMDDRALYITFCNGVFGKVTAKSLAAELGVENHQETYTIGDVVTCRVVKISKRHSNRRRHDEEEDDGDETHEDDDGMDVEEHSSENETRAFYQVLLSLKLQDASIAEGGTDGDNEILEGRHQAELENVAPKQVHIKAGAILPEKSMKIVELFKGKRRGKNFVPGYAIVSIKSKLLLDEWECSSMLPQMECKLPFDQLLDDYDPKEIETPEALDAMAARVLRVGKKINQKAIVLSDPHKSNIDHSSGIGKLTVVSLRKSLIATVEESSKSDEDDNSILLPSPSTHLFVGALVKGFIAQIDSRHGAFLRFLDGMTGLIPRVNGGLDLALYSTIVAKVQVIDDTVRPFRIMLQPLTGAKKSQVELPFKVGDTISKARVKGIQNLELTMEVLDENVPELRNVRVKIHSTMKEAEEAKLRLRKNPVPCGHFVKGHPFFGLKVDQILSDLTVVWVGRKKGLVTVQVTDRKSIIAEKEDPSSFPPVFISNRSELKPGMTVGAVVTDVHADNKGIQVLVSPLLRGFVPGLELSPHLALLNNIAFHVPLGAKLKCVVMDDSQWHENRAKSPFASRTQKSWSERKSTPEDKRPLFLSVIAVEEPTLAMVKPARNDLVIGRINKKLPQYHAPALMLALRGGFLARCCITELAESDDWENMPLGRTMTKQVSAERATQKPQKDEMDVDDREIADSSSDSGGEENDDRIDSIDSFRDGKYVRCRVLKSVPKQSLVEVSLRPSRLEGDLDDDETPPEGETIQAFVVETNKKGCFLRLARHIEGRATLTELCDGFLQDPSASFPAGRLILGKVKSIGPIQNKSKNSKSPARFKADIDMRESSLLEKQKVLSFEDIEVQKKYKGTVTRVESYGVFVQIEKSKVSGLVHLSECSDKFVKNLAAMYDPGDPVKVLVIKKDDTEKKIGFSMKASHFEEEEDSDDDSSIEKMEIEEFDSDDEDFASKLASKIQHESEDESEDESAKTGDDDNTDDNSDVTSSSSNLVEGEEDVEETPFLDTNTGFDWTFRGLVAEKKDQSNDDSSDDSESSDSDDEDDQDDAARTRSSHKSRKKQAQRRKEEKEISKREIALADGTADENPETPGDFERLLAGNPNSSELWIRYMAFHLSLADIPAARLVANKALDRIEFREEREKLNVWTALLTLEHKYGNEDSLRKAIDRACGQNNPKQVYLRVCEILDKDLSSVDGVSKADAMYSKMCSKFKSKKKVWLAHLSYLVRQSRHEEAHALLKQALLSLPSYKHAETMSKFAQLEFEFGSPERARTLFEGITTKYPKRLDLFFVFVDKEVKFGSFQTARSLLENKVHQSKLTDKNVKSIFKKWYSLEEQHGTAASLEYVKESARQYVQKTSD